MYGEGLWIGMVGMDWIWGGRFGGCFERKWVFLGGVGIERVVSLLGNDFYVCYYLFYLIFSSVSMSAIDFLFLFYF